MLAKATLRCPILTRLSPRLMRMLAFNDLVGDRRSSRISVLTKPFFCVLAVNRKWRAGELLTTLLSSSCAEARKRPRVSIVIGSEKNLSMPGFFFVRERTKLLFSPPVTLVAASETEKARSCVSGRSSAHFTAGRSSSGVAVRSTADEIDFWDADSCRAWNDNDAGVLV